MLKASQLISILVVIAYPSALPWVLGSLAVEACINVFLGLDTDVLNRLIAKLPTYWKWTKRAAIGVVGLAVVAGLFIAAVTAYDDNRTSSSSYEQPAQPEPMTQEQLAVWAATPHEPETTSAAVPSDPEPESTWISMISPSGQLYTVAPSYLASVIKRGSRIATPADIASRR